MASTEEGSVRVERSIGRIIKESSDLRHRLKHLAIAIVVCAVLCAIFSIAAHEFAFSSNFASFVRFDCRSTEYGPCLYHTLSPTKSEQQAPPGGSDSYNWTLVPLTLVHSDAAVNATTSGPSWKPRLGSAVFPFGKGLWSVDGLRAVASCFAVLAAALQFMFGYTLLDLETMAGACAQSLRATNRVPVDATSNKVVSVWSRIWNSGHSVRVRMKGPSLTN